MKKNRNKASSAQAMAAQTPLLVQCIRFCLTHPSRAVTKAFLIGRLGKGGFEAAIERGIFVKSSLRFEDTKKRQYVVRAEGRRLLAHSLMRDLNGLARMISHIIR